MTKIQYPFTKTIHSKLGIERNLLNMIKDLYNKNKTKQNKTNDILNSKRLNVFPTREQGKDAHSPHSYLTMYLKF